MKLADQIKWELIKFVRSNNYDVIIPNYYVGFNEMDVFKLTKSGFIYEYEIKISRSDFLADFKKVEKHLLFEHKKSPANRFFYVCPEGIIKAEEVPVYAGLIYFTAPYFKLVKNAPIVHKNRYPLNYNVIAQQLAFRCHVYDIRYRKLKQSLK